MTTTPGRRLFSLPQRTITAHPAQIWVFYRDDAGVYAERDVDRTKFTPEEATAYDACMVNATALESEWCDGYLEDAPRFPNIRLAIRYARLADEEECVADELQAYHAPSECGEIAYSSIRARRERLMQWANLCL
jgi:hypothetical protein